MQDYTILLIDYDPASSARLSRTLTEAGYWVEMASDGLAGIAAFQEVSPDLTLIEAMLPKKHGFEVCQELKRTSHGQRSAVWILTSVYKGQKYRTQAFLHYKCDKYLEKPIADEELLETVNRHFETLARRMESPTKEPDADSTEVPGATVTSFDPERRRTSRDSTPEVAPRELLPAGEPTFGTGLQPVAVREIPVPEPAVEVPAAEIPVPADAPVATDAPAGPGRGRLMVWIALILLAALAGLMLATVIH